MRPLPLSRLIPALLGAIGAVALSFLFGAPWPATMPAGLATALLIWSIGREPPPPPVRSADGPTDGFAAARPILAAMLEGFDAPLLLIERQQVILANAPALALLGQHIVGEDARLAIRHPAAAERLIGRGDPATAGNAIELVGLGDADRHWELAIHPIDATRRLARLADSTSRVITERMRVDFVANASHELRTPLATLIGFVETLQDDKAGGDPQTRGRFLKIMEGEARRMQRLVEDLISLSRIEGEKFTQPGERVALAPLLSEVVAASHCERVRSAVNGKPEARGDRAQLSQLLHNLIGNAIKYGRADAPIEVSIAPASGDMVRIVVADRGEGIAPEHLPRLTERFYRVDPGRSRTMGGTGLGLAIVKHIVERHRGRLDISSEPGTGTTVTVTLPAAPEAMSQDCNTAVT